MSSHNKTNTMADYEEIFGNAAVIIDCPDAEIIEGPDSHDDDASLPDLQVTVV